MCAPKCIFEYHTEEISIFSLGNALSYNPRDVDQKNVFCTIKEYTEVLISPVDKPRVTLWQRLPGKQHRELNRRISTIDRSVLQASHRDVVVMSRSPADGLLVHHRNIAIALTSRDCPYLVLWAEGHEDIAILHCGRDQLHDFDTNDRASVVESALTALLQYWEPKDIHGVITLGISPEHFHNERYPDIIWNIQQQWGSSVITDMERLTLDLKELILVQLESCGVDRHQIICDDIDTYSDTRCASTRAQRGGHNMILVNYKPFRT